MVLSERSKKLEVAFMSYDICKGITITKDKVFLNTADSSVRPLYFHKWECEPLSKMLVDEGRDAVLCRLGKDIWNGELKLYKGSKLCNLFLKAFDELPKDLHWSNMDDKAAGDYLGKSVLKLEAAPKVDLSEDVSALLELRNSKEHILEVAERSGYNLLDAADINVQKDRDFALKVLMAGAGRAWFKYPAYYADDRSFAFDALKINGCLYRELSERLKGDREIILEAFEEKEGKRFHEHLPDLIPPNVFFNFDADPLKPLLDKEFVLRLMHVCPSLHIDRTKWLLQDEDIALEWCKVGKWAIYDLGVYPQEFLLKKEFRDTVISRCEDEKQLAALGRKYDEVGLILRKPSLDEKIRIANSNRENNSQGDKTITENRDGIDRSW